MVGKGSGVGVSPIPEKPWNRGASRETQRDNGCSRELRQSKFGHLRGNAAHLVHRQSKSMNTNSTSKYFRRVSRLRCWRKRPSSQSRLEDWP